MSPGHIGGHVKDEIVTSADLVDIVCLSAIVLALVLGCLFRPSRERYQYIEFSAA